MRILDRLERAGFDVVAQRPRLGFSDAAWIAFRAAAMSRDTSFYYSFLVLPPRKRRAIIAVWDFCRAVDDAVDEAVDRTECDVGR